MISSSITSRPGFSSLFKVKRNTARFDEAFHFAHQPYGNGITRRPTKTLEETKRIKAEVENTYQSDYVEFIGLVPSLSHDPDCQKTYKSRLVD